ncbi:MAG: undecaprenyl-diphosphate phosphatase [Deltaproteobacteria bacterium]|nr:undecaprenyl-diphosphate phosphatase [Deltaproteobacteria bacterium]TLN02394.1 MAG: undecaprenyl-diphosphate phosphatase [bacterium]
MTGFEAGILGIVEGLTEFLPVSSTGHLILVSELLHLPQTEAHKAFEVAIQLGAILAVACLYWRKLIARSDLLLKLAVGFLPTGIIGLTLYKLVKNLFDPSVVSISLIVGGFAFFAMEYYLRNHKPAIHDAGDVSYRGAFTIGLVQCISMVPGVSRSGATIIGGLICGMSRTAAAEFSFLLALPTMLAATCYDVYKNAAAFQGSDWDNLLIGFIVSFIFSIIGIKILIRFVANHTFIPFGIYRIIAGALFLLLVV